VTANIEPHEAQAILAAVRPAAQAGAPAAVEPRDFGRPLRLSARALEEVRKRVQGALTPCEEKLTRALRAPIALELAELGEVSADGLFDELAEPFALVRFEVGGQPAWLRWDCAGAVAAVESMLGMQAATAGARALSAVERRFFLELAESITGPIARALELDARAARVVADADEAGAWTDGGERADSARLRLHVVCSGLAAATGIDLWLPGVASNERERVAPPEALPKHLDDVAVVLSARLGSREVPLAELLAIEAGDVIPLETSADGWLDVLAEDVPCARARLGCSAGRLALQIEEVGPPPTEPV
jgi:flagellar motor switch protein FliM